MSLNEAITDWSGKRVWLVGASSGIGQALAMQLRERGAILALSARRTEPLNALLPGSAAGSLALTMDVTDAESVQAATDKLDTAWPLIDLVIWMAGTYEPMQADTLDLAVVRRVMEANVIGPFNGLAALIPRMLAKGHGGIALVSSVAGYRGLPKSLAYGPSKAALTNLAESLYIDLNPRGIGIWVINPGFVETPLTDQNDFKMPALISPEQAADAIIAGFARGSFEIHFPKRFTLMLKVLRTLPYRWYFAATSRLIKV